LPLREKPPHSKETTDVAPEIEWTIVLVLNAVIIILLGIVFVWKTRKERNSGYATKDERTSKIHGKAAIGSFWITYAFMLAILVWVIVGNEFLELPEPELGWTIIAIMLVSSISYALLSWHHGKKGDVQ
jgi:ABC-type polysaccharide/polyol phosphate export permease